MKSEWLYCVHWKLYESYSWRFDLWNNLIHQVSRHTPSFQQSFWVFQFFSLCSLSAASTSSQRSLIYKVEYSYAYPSAAEIKIKLAKVTGKRPVQIIAEFSHAKGNFFSHRIKSGLVNRPTQLEWRNLWLSAYIYVKTSSAVPAGDDLDFWVERKFCISAASYLKVWR